MWLHDKFSDAENLLKYNPNWVLYTISERYAYFTLLPKPISEYNVKNAPFIFVKLFTDARQLARMPIKDFCTFACHSLAPIKGKESGYSDINMKNVPLIKHYYALPEVTYENLVSKPEDTLSAVFDVCGISKLLISEAVTALNRDSQAGTILSRDKMAQVKNLELTTLDRKKLNELVKKMELPESVFHF
ncbi:unnamed protein product [Rotaria sordida]|uniref:Uncharacterized protein n=1 Tax=Rotaria sordida TaxID=392033 RepID=A0A814RIU3_9BILA|nr:unnamed protein product [Rotaria sordida]CAF3812344.1 unnamed protein product [Rotaria sordida]